MPRCALLLALLFALATAARASSVPMVLNKPHANSPGDPIAIASQAEAVGDGIAAMNQQDYDKAITAFSLAIRTGYQPAVGYADRGLAFQKKGDAQHGLADCSAAVRLNPGLSAAWNTRGMCELDLRDNKNAEADFLTAARLDPENVAALNNLGIAYDNAGDFDRAIEAYTRVIALNPRLTEAYANRALSQEECGHYAEAIADCHQSLEIDPNNAKVYNELAYILATCPDAKIRDPKETMTNATQACKLTSWKDPNFLDTFAAACAVAGDFEAAVKWEQAALTMPDQKPDAITELKMHLALFQAHKFVVEHPKKPDAPPPATP